MRVVVERVYVEVMSRKRIVRLCSITFILDITNKTGLIVKAKQSTDVAALSFFDLICLAL